MNTLAERLKYALSVRKKSAVDLAKATSATESAVSQWLDGTTKSLRSTNLMKAAAFLSCNAPWLASNDGPSGLDVAQPPAASAPAPGIDGSDLVITQYDTGGAMGHGFNLTDHPPGMIKSWRVDHEWLRLNVPAHTGLKNLAIVTGFGPSMRPMFNPGDPLLVDTGVTVVDHEGVYFFRVGDEGYIKLIQRVPEFNGPGVILRIISKNPDFPPYDISAKNPHFQVLGKVLTVWRSEQY